MTPYRFKRSFKPLADYLKIMNESHRKVVLSQLKTIFGELHSEAPTLESLTDPTPADLDKVFMALGRAIFRVDLITQVNKQISDNYGKYSMISDPVRELVELREICQNEADLLNKMARGILQHNRKKEASNEQTRNTPSESVVPGNDNHTPDPVGHL